MSGNNLHISLCRKMGISERRKIALLLTLPERELLNQLLVLKDCHTVITENWSKNSYRQNNQRHHERNIDAHFMLCARRERKYNPKLTHQGRKSSYFDSHNLGTKGGKFRMRQTQTQKSRLVAEETKPRQGEE
ncbi:hypothetical protein ATANTOWER_021440 [Ataeniobius toweri]|uniref:Uncharacterized protein n=1 Tax=Ataeniobius toweri TaxID=208326 RepID=A0ABU7AHP9_9TELE|nr:hypothetical protein [Ataeniobius toweri]